MYLAQLFIPFLQFTEINITSFWSGGFTTPTAVNQRNGNLGNSIFVHFEMTFLTTLTGILDFANLIFQTGIFSQFKLVKKIKLDISNWRMSKIPKIPVQIDRGKVGSVVCLGISRISASNGTLWARATNYVKNV